LGLVVTRTNFENLSFYQLSVDLADELWIAVNQWEYFAKDTIGKQMMRAAGSIGANIAEGGGRGSDEDNRRFLRIARGSLYETKHFLKCVERRQLMPETQAKQLLSQVDDIIRIMNSYMRALNQTIRHNTPVKLKAQDLSPKTQGQSEGRK
jgi:four helix bundle protein